MGKCVPVTWQAWVPCSYLVDVSLLGCMKCSVYASSKPETRQPQSGESKLLLGKKQNATHSLETFIRALFWFN